MKKLYFVLISLICLEISGQTNINFETGIFGTLYNDIRIPGETGTFFSLSDDLEVWKIPAMK